MQTVKRKVPCEEGRLDRQAGEGLSEAEKPFGGKLWGTAVGVQWGLCVMPLAGAAPRPLTLGSFPPPSPCPGSLSVVWCYWTEPVGLSPGKVPLPPLGAWSLV